MTGIDACPPDGLGIATDNKYVRYQILYVASKGWMMLWVQWIVMYSHDTRQKCTYTVKTPGQMSMTNVGHRLYVFSAYLYWGKRTSYENEGVFRSGKHSMCKCFQKKIINYYLLYSFITAIFAKRIKPFIIKVLPIACLRLCWCARPCVHNCRLIINNIYYRTTLFLGYLTSVSLIRGHNTILD